MKLRVTPLNIAAALSLVFAAYLFLFPSHNEYGIHTLFKFLLIVLALVFFISDLIFRYSFKSLKKIWLVEIGFIAFTVLLILIIKK
ncbi:hypothetical protein GS399_11290 [Pedobacter sp. HMF7647]|uniref:Uncharacterized protein n=1 Tax=Hufsiella arboris TaxID=2695275 RepID=A0A7K1YAF1_9SPHI|nr:hypothetical protein [Hufsiella arboris]MXV51555.1 hypothetical protein [Hufsiella arboris]